MKSHDEKTAKIIVGAIGIKGIGFMHLVHHISIIDRAMLIERFYKICSGMIISLFNYAKQKEFAWMESVKILCPHY